MPDRRTTTVQARRRSNAAGKHGDRRLRRLKTRGSRKAAALREQQER